MMMCNYCADTENESFEQLVYVEKNGLFDKVYFQAVIRDNELIIYANRFGGNDGVLGKKKINFCPMCGRKL